MGSEGVPWTKIWNFCSTRIETAAPRAAETRARWTTSSGTSSGETAFSRVNGRGNRDRPGIGVCFPPVLICDLDPTGIPYARARRSNSRGERAQKGIVGEERDTRVWAVEAAAAGG